MGHGSALGWDTRQMPQVAGVFAVAPQLRERLWRAGGGGRDRSDPPCFDAQCVHRGGW